jgi:hypothetical protein
MCDPTVAAIEYLGRKFRWRHPEGQTDKAGRWYPLQTFECCKSIRQPTRSFPWSYMTHSRTALHVANEFGVDLKELKAAIKKQSLPLLIGREKWLDDYIYAVLKKG